MFSFLYSPDVHGNYLRSSWLLIQLAASDAFVACAVRFSYTYCLDGNVYFVYSMLAKLSLYNSLTENRFFRTVVSYAHFYVRTGWVMCLAVTSLCIMLIGRVNLSNVAADGASRDSGSVAMKVRVSDDPCVGVL